MSNPFLTKKDPLLEAVQAAMQDGQLRRNAEAIVNEAYGVYSRQAVVREDLASYDEDVEEVYAALKEGKLAAKDYDKDGKVESPKDEVWGSRLRAAKKAGKMEESEQIDEVSKKKAFGAYASSQDPEGEYSGIKPETGDRLKGHIVRKWGKKAGEHAERHADAEHYGRPGKFQKPDTLGSRYGNRSLGDMRVTKGGKVHGQDVASKKHEIKTRLGKHTKANLPEDWEGMQINEVGDTDRGKTKLRAVRDRAFNRAAGQIHRDNGQKPDEKIVRKNLDIEAQAKKRLNELTAFGKAFAAAKGQNFSFGGKQYSGAMKSSSSSATSSTPLPPKRPSSTMGSSSIAQRTTTAQSQGATPSVAPSAKNYPDAGNVATGKSFKDIDNRQMQATAPKNDFIKKGVDVAAKTDAAAKSAVSASMPASERSSIPTPPTQTTANKAGAPPVRPTGLSESVQVGANRYRIV